MHIKSLANHNTPNPLDATSVATRMGVWPDLNPAKNYEKLSKCIGGENVCTAFAIVKFYPIKFPVNLQFFTI